MERAECPDCGLLFREQAELKEHLESAHARTPSVAHYSEDGGGEKICSVCGEGFQSSPALLEHEVAQHR